MISYRFCFIFVVMMISKILRSRRYTWSEIRNDEACFWYANALLVASFILFSLICAAWTLCELMNGKTKSHLLNFRSSFQFLSTRMIGGGRHMASRRRGSSPMIRATLEAPEGTEISKGPSPRRRRACAVQDYKSCALIETRLKLGELV